MSASKRGKIAIERLESGAYLPPRRQLRTW